MGRAVQTRSQTEDAKGGGMEPMLEKLIRAMIEECGLFKWTKWGKIICCFPKS